MEHVYDCLYKVILLGDSGTGKSNLMIKFTRNEYHDNIQPTIGVEFGSSDITVDEKRIRVQIWDTAGKERYRSLTTSYYRGTSAAIITYNITRRSSFENVPSWVKLIRENCDDNILIVLVGTKTDLARHRAVTTQEGEQFAKNNNMLFYETSSFTGENVTKVFERIAETIYYSSYPIISKTDRTIIKLPSLESDSKKKCCHL